MCIWFSYTNHSVVYPQSLTLHRLPHNGHLLASTSTMTSIITEIANGVSYLFGHHDVNIDNTENDSDDNIPGPPEIPDPKYGKYSYILLRQDGTRSDELFEKAQLGDIFDWSYEFKTICRLDQPSIFDGPVTELSSWLLSIESGLCISLVMSEDRDGGENMWLKNRGLGGIFGDVVLVGETLSDQLEFGNIQIPIQESIDIAEGVLSKSGKTMMDCVIHTRRGMDASEVRMGPSCVVSSHEEFQNLFGKRSTDKTVQPPDDTNPVFYQKKCHVCKKSKTQATVTSCPCSRSYYCSKGCQALDWKVHKKYVHKGKFL